LKAIEKQRGTEFGSGYRGRQAGRQASKAGYTQINDRIKRGHEVLACIMSIGGTQKVKLGRVSFPFGPDFPAAG
jgi:hypothetical protein